MKEIHKKTPLAKQIKKYKSSYILLAPYSVLFLVFTLIPIAAAVLLSFTYFNMYEPPRWIGFTNYMNLFLADDVFIIALKNTLIFAFLTGPVGYVMSFIFAWLINEMKRVTRTFMTLFFYAPSLAGNVYFIWTYIFSGDAYGLVNSTLMRLNLIKEPVQWLYDPKYNIWIVVLVILWLSMGAGFLAFVAGLQAVDRSLYEAAAIDGVHNRFQELWYVTLPQMVPQLLFGAVMSISTSFAVGYESMALTGFPSTEYSTHTIVLHIYDFGFIRFEMGYASAIAVVLFCGMLLAWRLIRNLLSRINPA